VDIKSVWHLLALAARSRGQPLVWLGAAVQAGPRSGLETRVRTDCRGPQQQSVL